MSKVFIDGASGTTGLQIRTLLKHWEQAGKITLLNIESTRDTEQRQAAFEQADLSILCLPDEAAKKTISLLNKIGARAIDASSAFRTNPEWVFGFPELSPEQPALIRQARLVTNPGCFATGAISILKPLIDTKLIDPNQTHTIFGVSGYTGGGKKLIKRHHTANNTFKAANAFGLYSVNTQHKHVSEIKMHSGLTATPIFIPSVISQPRGMIVSIAFNRASLDANIWDTQKIFENSYNYKGSMVQVLPVDQDAKRINFTAFTDLNMNAIDPIPHVQIQVSGWEKGEDNQITIHALLDNLGKGASTQAIQNMALMLDELNP